MLEIETNNIAIINYELDFYFPSLKLALEVNGIFHREAIYGNDKLQRIQSNDFKKSVACLERGIQLIVYDDISKNFTDEVGENAWNQIRSLTEGHFCGA